MAPATTKKAGAKRGAQLAVNDADGDSSKFPSKLKPQLEEITAHFTQGAMARSVLSRKDAFFLLASAVERFSGTSSTSPLEDHITLKAVLDCANAQLGTYGFAIRKVIDERDGYLFYCFVNTQADELAKLTSGKARADWEVHFFKWIFETIVDGPPGEGYLARSDLQGFRDKLKELNVSKKLTALDVEGAVDRLLREGWIMETSNYPDKIMLGPRALAEMRKEISNARGTAELCCPVCRQAVVHGTLAPARAEDGAVGETGERYQHVGCLPKDQGKADYERVQEKETGLAAPLASLKSQIKAWESTVRGRKLHMAKPYAPTAEGSGLTASDDARASIHGVTASMGGAADAPKASSSSSGVGAKRGRRKAISADDESDEDQSEDAERSRQSVRRAPAKKKARKAARDDDEDSDDDSESE